MKEPKATLMDSLVPLVGTIATIRMKTKVRIENDLLVIPRGSKTLAADVPS